MLYELATHAGMVLTHDQMLQRVWGTEYSGETELVRSFIRNLRRKLGAVALAVVTGVADAGVALSALGNEVIFLFIGSFILAQAMSVHSLDRRIAFTSLSPPLVERSPLAMRLPWPAPQS